MRRSRAYRSTDVKGVCVEKVLRGREGESAVAGLDVGKFEIRCVLRWEDGKFERPWRAANPEQLGALTGVLQQVSGICPLVVAMESTGTYGEALRQALGDGGLEVHRVSGKATHDYAEIFDGVPSQHDGKDAAVVAELAALGKSWGWGYRAPEEADQELAYWVDWMDAHRVIEMMWLGRLEGLLARHWPEATRILKLSSATLLRALAHYGGTSGLAADGRGGERLRRWGRTYLTEEKRQRLVRSASETVGVRQGPGDVRRLRDYARQALSARGEVQQGKRALAELSQGNRILQAQSKAVGVGTACVLWVCLGDPGQYHCAQAYRKAMGLNLKERSSGKYEGQLKISKRGAPLVRRWLYFAALRMTRTWPVKRWYSRKKSRDAQQAKRALVGIMRRLALALYYVGAEGASFDPRRLFAGRDLMPVK